VVVITLADLLSETLDVDCDEVWENPVAFDGVVGTGSRCCTWFTRYWLISWLSLELDAWSSRSSGWPADRSVAGRCRWETNWVDGEEKWLYAAVDPESKLLLEVDVYSRRGTDPASAFLYQ